MIHETSTTHKISFVLYGGSFALFAINLYHELAGNPLNLRTEAGALVLTLFFGIGLIIQMSKMIEGHRSRIAVGTTFFLLGLHGIAELTVWVTTRIMGLRLPAELPYWVIGGYWVVGVFDILSIYVAREWGLLSGNRMTVEQQLARDRARLQERLTEVEEERNTLKDERAQLTGDLRVMKERLTMVEDGRTKVEQQLTTLKERMERERLERDRKHTVFCELCNWSAEYDSEDSARRGLASHMGRSHGGVDATNNGHKTEAERERE